MGLTAMFNKGMELRPTPDLNVVNYLTIRKWIGWLGITMPFVLILLNWLLTCQSQVQISISHYYYTIAGDYFVGCLFFVSVFLFTYKGTRQMENILTNIAGIFCLIVPFFPTPYKGFIPSDYPTNSFLLHCGYAPDWIGKVHFTSASAFFFTLALLSIFVFTKREQPLPEDKSKDKKPYRNVIYMSSGIIMILCLVSAAIYFCTKSTWSFLGFYPGITFFETIMLIAFGFSWLTKGRAIGILNDK